MVVVDRESPGHRVRPIGALSGLNTEHQCEGRNEYPPTQYGVTLEGVPVMCIPDFTPAGSLQQYDDALKPHVEATGTLYAPHLTAVDIVGDLGKPDWTLRYSEAYLAVAGRLSIDPSGDSGVPEHNRIILAHVNVTFDPYVAIVHTLNNAVYDYSPTGDDVKYHSPGTATYTGRERYGANGTPMNEAGRAEVYIHLNPNNPNTPLIGRYPNLYTNDGKEIHDYAPIRIFIRQRRSPHGTYADGLFMDTLGTDVTVQRTVIHDPKAEILAETEVKIVDGKENRQTYYRYKSSDVDLSYPYSNAAVERQENVVNTGINGNRAVELLPGSILTFSQHPEGPVFRVDTIHARGIPRPPLMMGKSQDFRNIPLQPQFRHVGIVRIA